MANNQQNKNNPGAQGNANQNSPEAPKDDQLNKNLQDNDVPPLEQARQEVKQELTAEQLKAKAAEKGLALVTQEGLDAMLKRLEDLEAKNADTNKKLDQVSDNSRLELYNRKQRSGIVTRVVRLNVRDIVVNKETGETVEKVIVGWRTIVDRVEKNPTSGVWTEVQIIELIYDDDTKEQVPYMDFAKNTRFVNAVIERRRKEEPFIDYDSSVDENGVALPIEYAGAEVLILKRQDNGKEYEIDSKFVN